MCLAVYSLGGDYDTLFDHYCISDRIAPTGHAFVFAELFLFFLIIITNDAGARFTVSRKPYFPSDCVFFF